MTGRSRRHRHRASRTRVIELSPIRERSRCAPTGPGTDHDSSGAATECRVYECGWRAHATPCWHAGRSQSRFESAPLRTIGKDWPSASRRRAAAPSLRGPPLVVASASGVGRCVRKFAGVRARRADTSGHVRGACLTTPELQFQICRGHGHVHNQGTVPMPGRSNNQGFIGIFPVCGVVLRGSRRRLGARRCPIRSWSPMLRRSCPWW